MPEPVQSQQSPHDEAEALLPWYATGQLDAADRALVENHLASCGRCQQLLTGERLLIEEFQTLTPEVESGWASLRARIERPAPWTLRRAANDAWDLFSRPGVAMLAAAQVGFLVLGGGLLLSMSRPTYHALGSTPVSAAANVIVIFRPDASEADLRDALRASGASLVGGPTSADAYLLHVAPAARSAALAKLQADHDVRMAQPIDGVAS